MKQDYVTRKDIITALTSALEPLTYVHALWEGGAASFKRVDDWSDIDLYVACDDNHIEETLKSMEQTFSDLTPIDLKFRLPEPTWHGHSQVFWRLKNASPFLFLDIVVMKKSSKEKFLQYKIHGKPLIHFDKIGIVKDDPIDPQFFLEKLETRLKTLKTNFELFQVLTLKELNRGNDVEALSYYIAYTYKPLVEVLRIKYCPYHHNFFTSYVYYELPAEVVKRLHQLYFIANAEELRKRRDEAETWFWDVVESIDRVTLEKKITKEST